MEMGDSAKRLTRHPMSMGPMKMTDSSPPVRTGSDSTRPMLMGSDSSHPMAMTDSMPMGDTADVHRQMSRHDSMAMHDSAAMMRAMPTGGPMRMGGAVPSPGMGSMGAGDMMTGPLGISMERMGSGTTWIPDAVSMPSRERMLGSWMLMAHGLADLQFDYQPGPRGGDQFGSLNWAMLMATRDLAGGRFQARTMLSLDALTVTSQGYPLLLQSGEAYHGQPLHDRQHPHDLFMELGALYQRKLASSVGWSLYGAPSGEPALGPVAFMHRPSAMDNPTAPLSHHWQDATHVSFGVLTAGIFTKKIQFEGSVFNGREPDENRWNFDPIKFDSYSGRVSVNPSANWSLSTGYGYLKTPEALHPKESMHRLTGSVLHGVKIGAEGQRASALIWGANKHSGRPGFSNSVLAESENILDKTNTLFGRVEWVQKSAEDLVVDKPSGSLAVFPSTQNFNISTVQLGYIREIARARWATIGLGSAATLNFVPSALKSNYGSRMPIGALIFLRMRPFHSSGGNHDAMQMGSQNHD